MSVDLRPATMPDERAQYFDYPADAEQTMLRSLGTFATAAQIEKIKIFRKDVSDIRAEDIQTKAHLALIDAEHTNTACFSDAVAVLDLVEANSIVIFHDANLISDAIQNFERMLKHLRIVSTTVFLPDCVAAIGLGSMAASVSDAFANVAFDRANYLQRVRKERWEMVAASVNQGLHQS